MNDKDITLSRSVLELVTIASEFCHFIETCSQQNSLSLLTSLRSFVPLLYLRGTLIPAIQPENSDASERFVTEEEWENVFLDLKKKLGDEDAFWILEEQSETDEPIKVSISEGLADTYQDLKDFILLFKKNKLSARENAIHDVKHLFEMNWGKKLSRLLPIIHALQTKTMIEPLIEDNLLDIND